MKQSDILLAILMREMDLGSVRSTEDKIRLQRKIYLAQQNGIDLGFSFVWGGSMMYSDDLMEVANDILKEGFLDIRGYNLQPKYLKIVDKINKMVG